MSQISPVSLVACIPCDCCPYPAWNAGQDILRMKKPFTAPAEGKGGFPSNKYTLHVLMMERDVTLLACLVVILTIISILLTSS